MTEAKKTAVKKWLGRYRTARGIYSVLSREASEWSTIKETLMAMEDSVEYEELIGSTGDAEILFSDWADKVGCVCAEIYSAINALPSEEALILTLRYIDGQKWKVIAKKVGYSERSVFRLHELALEEIDIIKASKKPPSLKYASDYLYTYASSTNVLGGEDLESAILSPDETEAFYD